MARLLVLVEGQTEEDFVNNLLSNYLYCHGFTSVSAKLLGNARQKNSRGGIKNWQSVALEITKHLKRECNAFITTMVDYYALPNNWPGREDAINLEFSRKASHIEVKVHKEIQSMMGDSWNPNYFIPFIMIHEFESLLFSDCEKFAASLGNTRLNRKFQKIRDQYNSPEEINDSPQSHPSKRITEIIPTYKKPLNGSQAAAKIGLDKMKQECPHFRDWLKRLELLRKDSNSYSEY